MRLMFTLSMFSILTVVLSPCEWGVSPIGLELAKAFVVVRGDTSKLPADLNKAKKQTLSSFRGFGSQIGAFIGIGAPAAAAGLAFKSLVGAGEEFNQKMLNSLAIMKDVGPALRQDMAQAAFEAARKTQSSASQAAESFFFLASAGLNAEQSIAALPQVAAFAQAGMFDMATATDLATDAQSALGLTVKDPIQNLKNLVRVTDTLTGANEIANTSTLLVAEALTNKAAVAGAKANKSIEEIVATLTVFANQGKKGREAGTLFAIALRDLQTKGRNNAAAFKALNIAVFDSSDMMRNMADIVGDLERAMGGMATKTRGATLEQLGFNDKSKAAIDILIGHSEELRENEERLLAMGGVTQRIADKQLTVMQKALNELSSAWTELGMNISNQIEGPVSRAILKLSELVSSLDDVAFKISELGVVSTLVGPVFFGLETINKDMAAAKFQMADFLDIMADVNDALEKVGIPSRGTGGLRDQAEAMREAAISLLPRVVETRTIGLGGPGGEGEVDDILPDEDEISKSVSALGAAQFALQQLKNQVFDLKEGTSPAVRALLDFSAIPELVGHKDAGILINDFADLTFELEALEKAASELAGVNRAEKSLKRMEFQVDSLILGLTSADGKLRDFAMREGVTSKQISRFRELTELMKSAEREEDKRLRGISITKSLETDVEKAQSAFKELKMLRDSGDISETTFQRGLRTQIDSLKDKDALKPQFGVVGFEGLGSQIQAAIFRREDPQRKTAEESVKHTRLLQAMLDALGLLDIFPGLTGDSE